MQGVKAGKRYAKALFDLAREAGSLEPVRADLAGLARLARESEAFEDFLSNPLVPDTRRNAVFDEVAKGADALTRKFLRFLDSKGRLEAIGAMHAAFDDLYCEAEGILRVTVTAAEPLTTEQCGALEERLARRHRKQIDLTVETDASLIGGFKLRIGDSIEDFSIASQLKRFKRNALNA